MASKPVIDMSACVMCEGCLAVCPQVFSINEAGGYLEVAELDQYPDCVDEAMAICPEDCISWEDGE